MKCDSLKYSKNEKYTGYKEIIMNDEEMAKFYETENKENVYTYNEDPLCGFTFTLNGFLNLFSFNNIACM